MWAEFKLTTQFFFLGTVGFSLRIDGRYFKQGLWASFRKASFTCQCKFVCIAKMNVIKFELRICTC